MSVLSWSRRNGFTLIELLVVIAIIGILMGMLMPAVQSIREAARRTSCANNLRQLALATHNYEGALRRYPGGLYQNAQFSGESAMPYTLRYYGHTIFALLLPYIEQDTLYNEWDFADNADAAKSNSVNPSTGMLDDRAISATIIATYVCPSDPLPDPVVELAHSGFGYPRGWFGMTSYAGCIGTFSGYFGDTDLIYDGTLFFVGPNSQAFLSQSNITDNERPLRMGELVDGTSQTIMFGEKKHFDPVYDDVLFANSTKAKYPIGSVGAWGWFGGGHGGNHVLASTRMPLNYMLPEGAADTWQNKDERLSAFGSGHPSGANFSFNDGSTRFVNDTIDMVTYQAMSTRGGREIISSEF